MFLVSSHLVTNKVYVSTFSSYFLSNRSPSAIIVYLNELCQMIDNSGNKIYFVDDFNKLVFCRLPV